MKYNCSREQCMRKLQQINIDATVINNLNLQGGGTKIKNRLKAVLSDLVFTARDAFQSKVPIDTGELRDYIDINIDDKSLTGYVYIEDRTHYGRRRTPESAIKVAEALDDAIHNFKRSRDSLPAGNYRAIREGAPTAGWIESGRRAFYQAYRKYLGLR